MQMLGGFFLQRGRRRLYKLLYNKRVQAMAAGIELV